MKRPDRPAAGSYEERRHQICEALFADPEPGRENDKRETAFPCCLHTSPCPYGWASRWRELAKAYGLAEDESPDDPSPRSTILGEAIQALGSTPSVREMVSQGRPAEAKEIVQRFVSGQEAATIEAPANQGT